MSASKEEIIMSMGEVLVVFKNLEYKNQTLHESIIHLQTNQISIFWGYIFTTQPQPKEPWISLFDKFDNTHSKF
jgi:hypothetical protein